MKKGELTLKVLADYFKAFDTVSFTLFCLPEDVRLGFSKTFLNIEWQTTYVITFSKSKLMIRNHYWNIWGFLRVNFRPAIV